MTSIKDNVIHMSNYKVFDCSLCKKKLFYKNNDSLFELLKNHSYICVSSYLEASKFI